ncbi:MAG TPA: GNAT family N-acetyltransferase [Candidatus Eisenbacteria bacterium]|nr:GNAT family N-acetyltransferase [Candidatus Eisenbacteria bacterium]
MRLGSLRASDLEAALALSAGEGWNQTAADWSRLLGLEPSGCFAARDGERLVGTVTTTTYGRELAWIGMMVVHPEHRGRGIGAALMRMALDHLRGLGVACVKLDATPAGQPLYASLGFEPEAEFERWQGVPSIRGGADEPSWDDDARRRVAALDRNAYGVDRERLLVALMENGTSAVVDGEGFALARPGRAATYIGPLIAASGLVAGKLLDEVLTRLAGEGVCLDLHIGGLLAPSALERRGLSKRRGLVRMRFGEPSPAGTSRSICAIAGPEFG